MSAGDVRITCPRMWAVKTYAAALLVLSSVGCQDSTLPTKAATTIAAPADSGKPVADTWERSLRCSERADAFATRMQRDYAKEPQDAQVMQWVSHYNGKGALNVHSDGWTRGS